MKEIITRILTVYYIYQNGKFMPFISLQGKWLQDLDFQRGDKIEVKGKSGRLFIRLVKNGINVETGKE
ncbi:MAG: Toxin SymE, type toxin-antitoxin system [Firmicutes bacterium]|nr:Toxin SymE, type toxin-antitoxin system [Bacillota bacterium]